MGAWGGVEVGGLSILPKGYISHGNSIILSNNFKWTHFRKLGPGDFPKRCGVQPKKWQHVLQRTAAGHCEEVGEVSGVLSDYKPSFSQSLLPSQGQKVFIMGT